MVRTFLIALIRLYQATLSPLLRLGGPVCRFEPSCSSYAAGCLAAHGAWRGSLLSLKRLCKCHPFHPGGFDAVPQSPTPSARPLHPLSPAPLLGAPAGDERSTNGS